MTAKKEWQRNYQLVRQQTENLCKPLCVEDYLIQGIVDVSPPKWHLAHTTWFFETFILKHAPHYHVFDPLFHHLFNSYYKTIGDAYPRDKRGLLARPSVERVYDYRQYVDAAILEFLEQLSDHSFLQIAKLIELGLHHEQQHQELLLMDIKYNFHLDPSFPVYSPYDSQPIMPQTTHFLEMTGGVTEIGHQGETFCFDNELPRHEFIVKPFAIANALVTNGEYIEFIEANGYGRADLWLDDGWMQVNKSAWVAPHYWLKQDNTWFIFTLQGLKPLNLAEPVSHLSYYEADAYARFRRCRLPTEYEWEYCAKTHENKNGNFVEDKIYHPLPAVGKHEVQHLFGNLWEWTASPYMPYPGYKPLSGSLGEYNGKFMNNQIVLRGGACVTPREHIRPSYRNFFQQEKRWQFSGVRLVKDI